MAESPSGLERIYDEHGEKLRFLVVGVCNTAISYTIFLVLLYVLGKPLQTLSDSDVALLARAGDSYYLIVQWVNWVFMVFVSTYTMKRFAFRNTGPFGPQLVKALGVYLPAQGLSTVLLWLTVEVVGLSPAIGQLVTIFVSIIFSYLGHKYFTFRMPLEVGEVPPRDLIEEPDTPHA